MRGAKKFNQERSFKKRKKENLFGQLVRFWQVGQIQESLNTPQSKLTFPPPDTLLLSFLNFFFSFFVF